MYYIDLLLQHICIGNSPSDNTVMTIIILFCTRSLSRNCTTHNSIMLMVKPDIKPVCRPYYADYIHTCLRIPLELAAATTINRMRATELADFLLQHCTDYLLYTSRSYSHRINVYKYILFTLLYYYY